MKEYTISQIAKLVGVNKETIRYYEKFGLLPLPERKSNGYKIYTQRHIEIMEIILIVKDSGFTLNEYKILYLFKKRILSLKMIYIRKLY